jgi:hypothetical protein
MKVTVSPGAQYALDGLKQNSSPKVPPPPLLLPEEPALDELELPAQPTASATRQNATIAKETASITRRESNILGPPCA